MPGVWIAPQFAAVHAKRSEYFTRNLRLPVAYLQFVALFEAIFRWNPAGGPLIRAISKDPLFALARGFQQLAMLRLPEREGNPGMEAGIAPR
jgi:hypothetical protein